MTLPRHHQSQRIFAIDPGSIIAGFACIDFHPQKKTWKERYATEQIGVIRLDRRKDHLDRMIDLTDAIDTLLCDLKPDVFVIEKAFCGNNQHSALKMGEVRGAVLCTAKRRMTQIIEITPAEVKKMIAGDGRASKEELALCLGRLLDFQRGTLPLDATDALAIAVSSVLRGSSIF